MSNHYQGTKGWRAKNAWGDGPLPAPYALGDVLDVPDNAPGVTDGRLEHGGKWRITATFSISEKDEWYFRASPLLLNGNTDWNDCSGRLHILDDYNALEGATLIESIDPDGLVERERVLEYWSIREQQADSLSKSARQLAADLREGGFSEEEEVILGLAGRLEAVAHESSQEHV